MKMAMTLLVFLPLLVSAVPSPSSRPVPPSHEPPNKDPLPDSNSLESLSYPRSVALVLDPGNGMPWGGWGRQVFCPTGTWATGFRLKVESPCNDCDDTALNGIELMCSHPSGSGHYGTLTSTVGPWGRWTPWQHCMNVPGNRFYLTAFRQDVEPHQRGGDDTAANNYDFYCRLLGANHKYELRGSSPAPWGSNRRWSATCPLGTAICGIQTKVEPRQGGGDDTALNAARMFCCHAG